MTDAGADDADQPTEGLTMGETNGRHEATGDAVGYRESAPDSLVGVRVQLARLGTVRTWKHGGLWWANVGREIGVGDRTSEAEALRALSDLARPLIAERLAKMPRPTPAEILGRDAVMLNKAVGVPVAQSAARPAADPASEGRDTSLDDWRFGEKANIGVGEGVGNG